MSWTPKEATKRAKFYNTALREILSRDKYTYIYIRGERVSHAEIMAGKYWDGQNLSGYLYFTLIGDRSNYGFYTNGESIQAFLEHLKTATEDTMNLKEMIRTLKAYE